MRFAIFTHVIHEEDKGRYSAYSPYMREMNLWLKYAEEVEIIAPRTSKGGGLTSLAAYEHSNVVFISIPAFNLLTISSILGSIIKIPFIFFRILGTMHRANHLHLRCPGNIGLLAAIAQVFFPKKPKSVKYAGNWDPEAKQPWTYRLQKWILSNRFLSRNIKVLVYGEWPNQSDNIIPLFTASFSEKEKEFIAKDFEQAYKFIFTGNLVEGKGIFEAIGLIESLKNRGVVSELDIYGDGVLEDSLRAYIQKQELQNLVKLRGCKSLEELKQAYKKAHFVVLLSKSEGWPKALAEGMWYGCIPVATSVSCVPWMLGEGSRGILIPDLEKREENKEKRGVLLNDEFKKNPQFEWSRDVSRTEFFKDDLASLTKLLKHPEKLKQMSIAAQEWSQQYTLEKFEKAIQEILGKHNPQPTTHNRELTTDNSKQQTPYKKPGTENQESKTYSLQPTIDNSQPTIDNKKHQTTNHKQLRVLQLIDTLNPGGAERMAVNFANSLVAEIETSYLCCTRKEGLLKEELEEGVEYLFLNKKNSLDLQAFLKLKGFVKKEQIEIIHTHGTSWFWGVLLKLSGMKVKLIWHDHSGANLELGDLKFSFLKIGSRFFDGIISVNDDLKAWAQKELRSPKVIQLNNFICTSNEVNTVEILKGSSTDFKIICVANLRPEKDHLNLIAAFEKLALNKISLHLIGADPGTAYSKEIREKISNSEKGIYYYGSLPEVSDLLSQAHLGVLSSRSEGLPLALLEYGMAGLPVVCTNVGQCKKIIGNAGILVDARNPECLSAAIDKYYNDSESRKQDALSLQADVKKAYSKEWVLPLLLNFYIKLRRK